MDGHDRPQVRRPPRARPLAPTAETASCTPPAGRPGPPCVGYQRPAVPASTARDHGRGASGDGGGWAKDSLAPLEALGLPRSWRPCAQALAAGCDHGGTLGQVWALRTSPLPAVRMHIGQSETWPPGLGGPRSNDSCPSKKGRGHRDAEERPREDGGRGWSHVATAAVPGASAGGLALPTP